MTRGHAAAGVEFAPWKTPVQRDDLTYYSAIGDHSELPMWSWRLARCLLPPPFGRHRFEVTYLSRNKLSAVEFRFADHTESRNLSCDEFARIRALAEGTSEFTTSTFKMRNYPRETPTHELWKRASHVGEYSYVIADHFGGGFEIVSSSEPVVELCPVDLLAFDGWPGVVVRDGPRTDAGELCGWDCVWLASDAAGRVAAMITAGQGPIPASAVSAPIDVLDIPERLLQLNVNGSARILVAHGTGYDEFPERGLYVYDWTDMMSFDSLRDRPRLDAYEAMAAPSFPLTVADLPEDLRRVAELTRFDVEFESSPTLHVKAEGP